LWRICEPSLSSRISAIRTIKREVGRGGIGVVYEAEDTRVRRLIAISELARRCRGAIVWPPLLTGNGIDTVIVFKPAGTSFNVPTYVA